MTRHQANTNNLRSGSANINDNLRTVYIGHREIGGKTGQLGWKLLGLSTGAPLALAGLRGKSLPNVSRHWCVIVGDYYHQLQATSLGLKETGWNWYDNGKVSWNDFWDKCEVGNTTYNDVAIASAGEVTSFRLLKKINTLDFAVQDPHQLNMSLLPGERAIDSMPEEYNLMYNNCQTFVIRLLDIICRSGRKRVDTSFGKQQIAFIPGYIDDDEDEEEDKKSEHRQAEAAFTEYPDQMAQLLDAAQKVMIENTPLLKTEDMEEASGTVEVNA